MRWAGAGPCSCWRASWAQSPSRASRSGWPRPRHPTPLPAPTSRGPALLLVVGGVAGVVLFVAVYGAANGIATLTRATAVAELYGAEYYGSISSVVAAASAVAGALAPFAAAAAIDALGRDTPVLWA